MKLPLNILFFIFLSYFGFGQAQITFEQEVFDLGRIRYGSKPIWESWFTNSGDSTLIIYDAVGSGGHLGADFPKTPVKPGDKSQFYCSNPFKISQAVRSERKIDIRT